MKRQYYKLPVINGRYIEDQEYFLLFESSLFDRENFLSYIFMHPKEVIKIHRFQDIDAAFDKIEGYAQEYYIAGYLSYELGYYFEQASFRLKPSFAYPLINLCVFDQVISFNHKTGRLNTSVPGLFHAHEPLRENDYSLSNLKLSFKKKAYIDKIGRIKEYIRRGQTYQVNFTGKYLFDFSGSAYSFYRDLGNRQSVSYGAFCKFRDEYVISLSPELFFRRNGQRICAKPMKGTISRGRNILEDRERALRLRSSAKDLAENIMIVDLIRNDLGRICRINSVKTTHIFSLEKYKTLFQMTSTVQGMLKKGATYLDIFKNIFPGGSVTGAPKIRTMQLIKELESRLRNVYCGALGIIFPRKKAVFNMPIRTVFLAKNKGEMGVGSGIVIDSHPEEEFRECILKAKFLTDRYKAFRIIETIFWNRGYKFLKEHLRRMRDSAEYFDFSFEASRLISLLKGRSSRFEKGYRYKVRILLDKEGRFVIDGGKIRERKSDKKKYIIVSRHRCDPDDLFLYHKTTNRQLYDAEYDSYSGRGYFDVIFLNTRDEITEGAISNIIIQKKGEFYTPPVSSGLLAGIFRADLIKRHRIKERVIFLKDLLKADKIFLCNSVRGLNEVKILSS